MSLKKKLLRVSVILSITIAFLILFYHKQIMRIFKKTEHLQLQYENVEYADILLDNKKGLIKLNDLYAVKSLTNYLNDFELIEEEYDNENEIFTLYLGGNMPATVISFSENHIYFSDAECWDCTYTNYYIVGSGNSSVKVKELYNFLNELINEYTEE